MRRLAQMSDAEFVRALRAWRRSVEASPPAPEAIGKTLATVFEEERRSLARRCFALTLANANAMMHAPIGGNAWWAPSRIHAYVNEARIEEFVALTGAEQQSRLKPFYRLPVMGDVPRADFHVAPGTFSRRGETVRPLVWWTRADDGSPHEVPLFALMAEHTLPATLSEWRRIARTNALGLFSFDERVQWFLDTSEWPEGAVEHADPEPRAAIRASAIVKLHGSPERVLTPWGEIEPEASRSLSERIALADEARTLSTFAYEVPYLVDEDEVLR